MVQRKLPLYRTVVFGLLVSLLPASSSRADVIELSQSQLRQLVSQDQIQGAETVAGAAVSTFGGTPLDIRGFLSDGRMTYRLLLQRNDGSVIEVLMNGQTAKQVPHSSSVGQAVAAQARTKTVGANGSGRDAREPTGNASASATSARSNGGQGGNAFNAISTNARNNRDNDRNNRGNKTNRGNGASDKN